eukprot:TRINITY_DN18040_c0_g1_i3.p1 TRINITY_DN18040_c0_g1~~TRINITY_DN18040_c0_g1_i3.p1  ORF type:complete len:267 (+),score=58.43 TRINITY_DN18040_c0_g1_i3:151-951(+)
MSSTRVFVGGLPKICLDHELWEAFADAFGSIRHAYVVRFESGCSRGFGFIDFSDQPSRDRAVAAGTLEIKGHPAQIKAATNDKHAAAPPKPTVVPPPEQPANVDVPLSKWGLDPMFSTDLKVLGKRLHDAEEFSAIPGSTKLNGHPVISVEVLGVVVTIERKDKCVRFQIDDGSALVWCVRWFENGPLEWDDQMLGQLVSVRGRVGVYEGSRQVTVSSAQLEADPNAEVLHWLDLIHLHRECYSKPFVETGGTVLSSSSPNWAPTS